MTRKEWMLKNHPNEVFPMVRGGVIGCPGTYLDLVDVDPSTAELRSPDCHMYPHCTDCWNAPLPEEGIHPSDKVEIRKTMGEPHIKEERSETTALCDRCNCAPICSIKCNYHQTLADLTSLKKKNPAFTITCDCKYFTPISCEKGE